MGHFIWGPKEMSVGVVKKMEAAEKLPFQGGRRQEETHGIDAYLRHRLGLSSRDYNME
jgi:hypothetical protein